MSCPRIDTALHVNIIGPKNINPRVNILRFLCRLIFHIF